jgi:hypothetical protein
VISVLASCVTNHGFELMSGQTKDYKIGISYFSAKHTAKCTRFSKEKKVSSICKHIDCNGQTRNLHNQDPVSYASKY